MKTAHAAQNLSWNHMQRIFRRMHRTMPEQEYRIDIVGGGGCRAGRCCRAGVPRRRKLARKQPRRSRRGRAGQPRRIRPAQGRARPAARPAGPPASRVRKRPQARRARAASPIATMPSATWSKSFCRCWTTSSWRSSPAGTAEQLRSGVELIVKQMEDVLRQLHVTPIPADGRGVRPAPS